MKISKVTDYAALRPVLLLFHNKMFDNQAIIIISIIWAAMRQNLLVREPAILLIKWLRPKGLKVCSYVEKYAEFKNQTLKKSAGTQKCYAQRSTPGVGNFSN